MHADVLLSQSMFDLLYQATLVIAGADSVDVMLQTVVDSARQLLGADYAAISMPDEQGGFAKLVVSGMESSAAAGIAAVPEGKGVLGRLISQRQPIRLANVADDPASAGFPAGHPVMGSFIGVPIISGKELLGSIYLTNKLDGGGFTENDQRLLEMLAAHAAIAIRKALMLESRAADGRQLAERNNQLAGLNKAAMAITSELTLDKVLQQIVDSLRDLVHAQYAALGVSDQGGTLTTFVHSGMDESVVSGMPHLPRGAGLLGAIIKEKRPIRVARISDDPRSVGFPKGHPPMASFMGVPLVMGGQTLGNLYLTNKDGGVEFSSADQELVEMLAAHAAIVVQNSRLYEQVGRLAVIAERARIGMDLHDGIIQSIYAVGLTLESARLALPGDIEDADQLVAQAIGGLNETIRDIRNFILDLRPHRFSGDLDQGIGRLVREFQANTMVPVTLKMELDNNLSIPSSVSRALFLTTQEALANIARHARATGVIIEAKYVDSTVELTIVDNGLGFDKKSQSQTVGHGLSNMRARAESLKGSFALESAPGEGTSVRLKLPRS